MWNSININKFENIIHKIIYIDLKHLEIANKIKFKPPLLDGRRTPATGHPPLRMPRSALP